MSRARRGPWRCINMQTLIRHSYLFSWVVEKALSNMRKHGIAFEDALEVFADPLASNRPDSGLANEERWLALGMTQHKALVVVVHLYEERDDYDSVRIISARRATKRERLEYETGVTLIREAIPTGDYNMTNDRDEDGMCDEYDFSNAVRGKFYRPNMRVSFPIYLDFDVLEHFRSIARSRGVETRELLNEILRRQMPAQEEPEPLERR